MGFMPTALRIYHQHRPDVEVNLVELPLMDQLAALQEGTIQVAFTIWGRLPCPAAIRQVKILRSPLRVAMHRSHPLASRAKVRLADVARETLICFLPRRSALPVHAMLTRRVFKARSLKIRPLREIEGAEAFRATLESGLGVALVAEIGNLASNRELVLKPIQDTGSDLSTELHALLLRSEASPLAMEFVTLIRDCEDIQDWSARNAPRTAAVRTGAGSARKARGSPVPALT
jgi:DNA-binding transcriptional LysR family regulator